MKYETWFDTEENRALLAIGARKTIKGIGIGGIIWGMINVGLGISYITDDPINFIVIVLGLLMLTVGIVALVKPARAALLLESISAFLLFAWNVTAFIMNIVTGAEPDARGLVFPLIIAIAFMVQYFRLSHISELIDTIPAESVKQATDVAKAILKAKPAESPNVIVAQMNAARIQLLEDRAFYVQPGLSKAFVMSRDEFRSTFEDLPAKTLKMKLTHPLGKLAVTFKKENADRLRAWLAGDTTSGNVPGESEPLTTL
ncbi:MAG: hypothetical protein JW909_13790 [Planctomycetes bacterium]|nr:hypothetical protein [Planctomycetota bacterium]